jgi:nitrogen fixation/metabolism regulation signal transduction histidine kinase
LKLRRQVLYIIFLFSLLGSVFTVYRAQKPALPQDVVDDIATNLSREFRAMDEEAKTFFSKLPVEGVPPSRRFSFFIYDHQQISYWSDNGFVPTYSSVADTFKIKLLRSGNSDYLARKWPVSAQRFVIGVIPLYRKFNITNDYLNAEWNNTIFPHGNISILDPNASLGLPVCIQQVCAFRISFVQQSLPVHERTKVAAVIFISLTIFLFLSWAYQMLDKLPYPDLSFISLYAFLFGVRTAMTYYNFPTLFLPSDLFNPQIFASSNLNASLGDLLLNEIAIFILCFYLFKNLFHFRIIRYFQQKQVSSWILSVLAGVFVMFSMLFPFVVIQTLSNNSSIPLDLSQSLQFSWLRIAAMLAILFSGICTFLFAHAFIRLLISDGNKVRIMISFTLACIIFAGVNTYTGQEYISSLVVGICYFAIVYFLKLYASLQRLGFTTFAYLFVCVFFLSANGAYAVQYFSLKEKIDNQFRFARNFLIERDYFGEYLLGELEEEISKDVFIQKRIATPFLRKDAIRQKIRQVYLPSYFNKYDVEIYIFNASGEPEDNHSGISFSSLLTLYDQDAYRTTYAGVFYISSPASDITQKYLVKVPVRRSNAVLGYVVIELSLKKIIPENVYPELLVDNRFQQFYRSQEISYAVFTGDKLLYASGTFNYEGYFNKSVLGDRKLYNGGMQMAGFDHIALEDENGRIAVVSSREKPLTFILSNFSFFLVLGLSAILFFILLQGLISYLQGDKLYFSARIQLLLNLAFFLPLFIVSIVTLSVTNRSSKNQINEEYISKAKKFSEQIEGQFRTSLTAKDENVISFENQLTDLAKVSNLDANVYSASGILLATSQPLIFENSLISDYINAVAIQKVKQGENLFIETEQVGALKYHVAYAALKASSSGELLGILGIPFFQSVHSLERVQLNILANILNIFSLIFIVLIAVSYFVSQWLTFPLKFITQSLKKTSLTKINQPLVWKSDDEIGLMVKEYNQMLYKLSESKAELEQTQRERAWREIAQQVAHEIKNPLTPMKLTLQQLERNVQGGTSSPEKTQKAVESLLSQVNTLNDIASSFSAFAKMPEPVIRKLDLGALLKRIVNLHSHTGELILDIPTQLIEVNADEQMLGRTFSNLIINAFQASKPGVAAVVQIRLRKENQYAVITFKDNGKGIEPDVAERIFVPHFTTKKSGSGLGLAITKQAIEQMKGRIWFETEVGKGTTFFMELPLS